MARKSLASSSSPILKIENIEAFDPSKEESKNKFATTILKLPSYFKEENEKSYEPKVVSIGPYHYGKQHLIPMDLYKQRAVSFLIYRSMEPNNIDSVKSKLMKNVKEFKDFYEQLDEEWREDDDRFIDLMILDGYFLLAFLIEQRTHHDKSFFNFMGKLVQSQVLIEDLLMVVNQMPYDVILLLYSNLKPGYTRQEAHARISCLFSEPDCSPYNGPIPPHLLELASNSIQVGRSTGPLDLHLQYTVSQLYWEFGIVFVEAHSSPGKYNAIKFNEKNAVLTLPCIKISTYSRTPFLNTLAYKLWVIRDFELYGYLCLMKSLVKSTKDIEILRSRGIIKTDHPDSDEVVLEKVRMLTESVRTLEYAIPTSYSEVVNQMNKYFKLDEIESYRLMRAWYIYCYEKCLSSPWVLTTVLVGIFISSLTLIQTIYTVLSYVRPK